MVYAPFLKLNERFSTKTLDFDLFTKVSSISKGAGKKEKGGGGQRKCWLRGSTEERCQECGREVFLALLCFVELGGKGGR